MNPIYNNPAEWLKKPLVDRLEELRKINCTGPCGQSHSSFCKRDCENETLKQAIELIKTIDKKQDDVHYLADIITNENIDKDSKDNAIIDLVELLVYDVPISKEKNE